MRTLSQRKLKIGDRITLEPLYTASKGVPLDAITLSVLRNGDVCIKFSVKQSALVKALYGEIK